MPIPPEEALSEVELAAIPGSENYPSPQWLMRQANMAAAKTIPTLPEAPLDSEQDDIDQMAEIFGNPMLLGC